MKRTLDVLTIDQLVDRFAEIGIAQDKALLYDEHKKFNRLFNEMNEVDQELRRRGVEARQALLRLYDHPNMQVRVKAAIRTLAVAPTAARLALQEIKETHCYPQAADASMILRDFDNGSYKPD
ncbi:hypothetical protein CU048_04590 [Beijerinckiaceae bacterium]|nr:hypothetical protein CU048_04590 [Beijerinckiaceae bacterium]